MCAVIPAETARAAVLHAERHGSTCTMSYELWLTPSVTVRQMLNWPSVLLCLSIITSPRRSLIFWFITVKQLDAISTLWLHLYAIVDTTGLRAVARLKPFLAK